MRPGRAYIDELLGDSIVWDNHACMPLRPDDDSFLPQLERVREAGVDALTLNVGCGGQGIEEHVRMLGALRHWIGAQPDRYMLLEHAESVRQAKDLGKLGICFDIEGMDALGGQASLVEVYYALGVRWMLVAYNLANLAGGGCMEDDQGLTAFGRAIVAEMNRVGMVPCGSHTGYRTARESIDTSSTPVIFSHSNPRALWDHPRNIPNDLMSACAARGGVIGINGIGIFLGNNDSSVSTFANHVEYALERVGEDHVGIALDYVFDDQEVAQFAAANPTMFPANAGYGAGMAMIAPWQLDSILEELCRRGLGQQTLQKLMGGNHFRIATEVWR
jgi:membrane dipeptidase